MRIVHISMNYMVGWNYQENVLTQEMAKQGHEVHLIAPKMVWPIYSDFVSSETRAFLDKSVFMDGQVKIHYLSMRKYISYRFYKISGLPDLLEKLDPDIVLVHGMQNLSILDAMKYKKKHPKVILYTDNHADYINSAKVWISRNILHKCFYRWCVQKSLPYIQKVLCTTPRRVLFVQEMYGVPANMTELYMMGGIVLSDEERINRRMKVRNAYNISREKIVVFHAGKMDKTKRTIELLEAFFEVKNPLLTLVIAGTVAEDIRSEFDAILSKDRRIQYIGWLSGEELLDFYTASDIYMQPGLHSVNVENAMCAGCVLAISNEANNDVVTSENGWIISDSDSIKQALEEISNEPQILHEMQKASLNFAKKNLDYSMLAKRIYQ